MASGILASLDVTGANTNYTVYTVPTAKLATVVINICNRSATASAQVNIAVGTSDTPATSDYIEYYTTVNALSVLERGGIMLAAGQKIVVKSQQVGVSVVVWGIEQ